MTTFQHGEEVVVIPGRDWPWLTGDGPVTMTYISPMHGVGWDGYHCVHTNHHGLKCVKTEEISKPKVKNEGWVNIYRRKSGVTWNSMTHESEEEAVKGRTGGGGKPDPEYVATVRIEWEE